MDTGAGRLGECVYAYKQGKLKCYAICMGQHVTTWLGALRRLTAVCVAGLLFM